MSSEVAFSSSASPPLQSSSSTLISCGLAEVMGKSSEIYYALPSCVTRTALVVFRFRYRSVPGFDSGDPSL
ncbi:hypothetical protein GSI_11973 [Ganoderma sinense ZZ0214-1]|uniref:Uncharacterized protein n=1 Tax=Ganoderma sinense ZZ0214-1 TaxID=1077348 RepID=A0A2G8RY22_9APHY|nr:hypothetical protein GSI_11973 [Ganoderma sinense ZZ0214-1]